MKRPATQYTLRHKLSGILMLLALVWLTVSIPYVYRAQQEIAKAEQQQPASGDDESDNPFANTTEEKTCSSTNMPTEEFLHDHHHELPHHFTEITSDLIHAHEATYVAFHGEMLCPPPNA